MVQAQALNAYGGHLVGHKVSPQSMSLWSTTIIEINENRYVVIQQGRNQEESANDSVCSQTLKSAFGWRHRVSRVATMSSTRGRNRQVIFQPTGVQAIETLNQSKRPN
jgi:hypothetical protein